MSDLDFIDEIESEAFADNEPVINDEILETELASKINVLRKLNRPTARRRIEYYFDLQHLRENINDPYYHL